MVTESQSVLVLNGAPDMGDLLLEFLSGRGYVAESLGSAEEALQKLSESHFGFLLISEGIQGLAVVDLVERAVALQPDIYVILASSREELSQKIRGFHMKFRRLPAPLVLEDLYRILQANSPKVDAC